LRLEFPSASSQYGFRIAVGLSSPGKDQIQDRLKRRTVVEVGRHVAASGIALILVIPNGGHFLECLPPARDR
jgi:hypothetical protein